LTSIRPAAGIPQPSPMTPVVSVINEPQILQAQIVLP
jgi:hypothetical protein